MHFGCTSENIFLAFIQKYKHTFQFLCCAFFNYHCRTGSMVSSSYYVGLLCVTHCILKLESYSCKPHCFGHSPFSIVLKWPLATEWLCWKKSLGACLESGELSNVSYMRELFTLKWLKQTQLNRSTVSEIKIVFIVTKLLSYQV